MYNNVYVECVGYAFEQCYSSDISITREYTSDTECLHELKALVAEYEMALEVADPDKEIRWDISEEVRAKIKAAKTLDEAHA